MLRVFYTAGPGNAFASFAEWRAGRRELINSHIGYSRQMMEACARHDVQARISCTFDGGRDESHDGVTIVARPDPTRGKSGIGFQIGHYRKARQNIRDALDFGANVVVVGEDTIPGLYGSLRRRGILVVQSLHTRIWPEGHNHSAMQRLRLRGFRNGYRNGRTVVLSSSDAVTDQVERIAGAGQAPILEFLPSYYPEHYAGLPEPDWQARDLNIAYVGRVEANKGALELVEVAALLKAAGSAATFQICGIGGALDEMKAMVRDRGLDDRFTFHGWCDRAALRAVMAGCHLTIVPTRSDVFEGFNQVVVESILSGRPVIASSNCPAVDYVGDAATVVQASDLSGYVAAIRALEGDRDRLMAQRAACAPAGARFTDDRHSFGAAMDEVFDAVKEGRAVRPRRIPARG